MDSAASKTNVKKLESGKFPVVGIGASAGGLEAIEAFFAEMPVDTGMAFVVIQHLSPDFKSHMDELIARKTNIPVVQVENETRVQPDTIFLLPAKMEMTIKDRKLHLTERDTQRSFSRPIDLFFCSLAEDLGERAVGIVLSGTGSDGSVGVRAIHDAGGLVFAQNVQSAKFDGMPRSAEATGAVDVLLPPEAMPAALIRYATQQVPRDQLSAAHAVRDDSSGIDRIFELLLGKFALDFSDYKPSTVGRRIHRRMDLLNIQSLERYAELLSVDGNELDNLYRDLLIGVTRFFRDSDAFETLANRVIPQLVEQVTEGQTLRVWVVGCASGEEAYSVAILLDEERRRCEVPFEFKVFATDAHAASIQAAARGRYSQQAVMELSAERRQRYFRKDGDAFQVTPELRQLMIFAAHNVIRDAPFTQMDLLTCRNMLIYLQTAAQSKAISLFHFALKAGGILFLGPSESTGPMSDEFTTVDSHWRMYQKRRDLRMPLGIPLLSGLPPEKMPRLSVLRPTSSAGRVDRKLVSDYDELLNQKMGRSLLIDRSGQILHIFGGADKYLRFASGRPSTQILDAIDEQLKSSLSAAIQHSIRKGDCVRYSDIAYSCEEERNQLELTVEPIGDPHTGSGNLLIRFELIATESPASQQLASSDMSQIKGERISALETELKYSQENLQATIEEMETSNEELQASNEELVASNEELQSTNEELHSVNEELYTVNAEHQRRVEELAEANADMDNLLAITRVGVLYLDSELRIRRYTPAIAEVLQLRTNDLGRSIEDFASRLDHPALCQELQSILETETPIEARVTDRAGVPYLLRMVPYRFGQRTRGVVLTLIDIASIVRAEVQLQLHHLAIEATLNGIVITDPNLPDNPITYANPGFCQLTGYSREEVLGRNCRFLQGAETNPEAIREIRQAIGAGKSCRVALLNYRKNGSSFWNDLQITPVFDELGRLTNLVGIQNDVTESIQIREALEAASRDARRVSEAKSAFMANMSHELRTPMTAVLGFADMLVEELKDHEQLEKVNTIKRNGEYLLALLNDILDLSKIEAGQLEIAQDPISLKDVVSDVQSLMELRSVQEGVPLHFEWLSEVPDSIVGDKIRIRQILVNLIGNALKFTNEGEVRVKVGLELGIAQPAIHFAVHDTGIGIHTSHLNELFIPFSQTGIERRRRFGGTGLGLSICKRLAEGMGGTISVKSTLGIGSVFTFSLPLEKRQLENARVSQAAPKTGRDMSAENREWPNLDARVLLADDRRDIWRIGKYFLEKCGAAVTVVEDGLQAIEEMKRAAAIRRPFDLILMDMQMPVMTGREAVAELRQLGFTLPIIALTADAMDGEREACLAMGCDDYVPKPIDGAQLAQVVASHLAK